MDHFVFNTCIVEQPDQELINSFNQSTTVYLRELEKIALRTINVKIDECEFIGQLEGHYAFMTDRGLMVVFLSDEDGLMSNARVEEIF